MLLILRWYNMSSSSNTSLPSLLASDLASDQLASLQSDGAYVSLSRLRLRLQAWHDLTTLYCVASNLDLKQTLEEVHCVDQFKLYVQERLSKSVQWHSKLFKYLTNLICHTLHHLNSIFNN